jgi:energy-coupling factor transporter ATP-binding protein EcfA2
MGYTTIAPKNLDPLCTRVQQIFGLFASHPEYLQHLLLYGPPGSGKTSTVEWLLNKIWGDSHMKVQTCRILNAADERSLDAIRAKIIPFVSTDWRDPSDMRPRFLVLDECETLTDSAQLALRPFLDNSPQNICIIFICNSLSRVQMSLRSRCLRIRFDPPTTNSLQTQSMRGDLRGARILRNDICHFMEFLHSNPDKYTLTVTVSELIQASLFFCTSLQFMDEEIINVHKPLMEVGVDLLPPYVIASFLRTIRSTILRKFDSFAWAPLKVQPSTPHNVSIIPTKPIRKRRSTAPAAPK